jgi:hypothetical protein
MRNFSTALAVVILPVQITVLCAASPAAALSADVAKKCQVLAVKAHPPPIPPGNKAYAQAERDFFRECVSKDGQMPEQGTPKGDPPAPNK